MNQPPRIDHNTPKAAIKAEIERLQAILTPATTGGVIRLLRQRAGLTKEQLANVMRVKPHVITCIETRDGANLTTLRAVARGLGIKPSTILLELERIEDARIPHG